MNSHYVPLKPVIFLGVVRRVFSGPERHLAFIALATWPVMSDFLGQPCAACDYDRRDHSVRGRCPA